MCRLPPPIWGTGVCTHAFPKFRFRNARDLAPEKETRHKTERTAIFGACDSVPPSREGGVEGGECRPEILCT